MYLDDGITCLDDDIKYLDDVIFFVGYVFVAVLNGPNVHISQNAILKLAMNRDFSHCSALAVTHQTKAIPEMLKIKELMHGIGSDFRKSYQKMLEYRNIFWSLHEDIIKFEICPATH